VTALDHLGGVIDELLELAERTRRREPPTVAELLGITLRVNRAIRAIHKGESNG